MLKVNNRNTTTRCEICSIFTIKTLERRRTTIGELSLWPCANDRDQKSDPCLSLVIPLFFNGFERKLKKRHSK